MNASTGTEARTGRFVDNMSLPVHRWFRYSAGFSAAWASALIDARRPTRVIDPFVGSGTTSLAADAAGVQSLGLEAHPFVYRVARAKLTAVEPAAWLARVEDLVREARGRSSDPRGAPALLERCYSEHTLDALERLRRVHLDRADGSPSSELTWLALTSILRACARVGTAQWQYVLPNRAKARPVEPFEALRARARLFAADLASTASVPRRAALRLADARDAIPADGPFDLVLGSPPYPNNFDYADATRLEMTFWRQVERWADLHDAVRRRLVRSCSQHSAAERLTLPELLEAPELEPIHAPLSRVCDELAEVRLERGGRKTYHTMVAAYFSDLARVLHALRQVTTADATVCLVVGDSAPYGVHVPVDEWLGRLAEAAGFERPRFEKLRDRNTRWKNRKHRVPLKEGRLWLGPAVG